MDEQLTLHELTRFEAERKLKTFPPTILETAWVRETQIEAVIDAVLVVGLADVEAVALARHTGEWCARIVGALQKGPDPVLARRAGVLSGIDVATLERIPELRHIAERAQTAMLSAIVAVARDFASRIALDAHGHMRSPRIALQTMLAEANDQTLPIVKALQTALPGARHARVA